MSKCSVDGAGYWLIRDYSILSIVFCMFRGFIILKISQLKKISAMQMVDHPVTSLSPSFWPKLQNKFSSHDVVTVSSI